MKRFVELEQCALAAVCWRR